MNLGKTLMNIADPFNFIRGQDGQIGFGDAVRMAGFGLKFTPASAFSDALMTAGNKIESDQIASGKKGFFGGVTGKSLVSGLTTGAVSYAQNGPGGSVNAYSNVRMG